MAATTRESLLSIVAAWINIYLRNADTDNSRKRIIGAACLNCSCSRYCGCYAGESVLKPVSKEAVRNGYKFV